MSCIMSVDLAAKMSAYTMVTNAGEVIEQGASWQKTEDEFIGELVRDVHQCNPVEIIIEDLPHGVRFMSLVKHVCRLQGRIIDRFHQDGLDARILFLPPATWQRSFVGVWRKGPSAIIEMAASLGYVAPIDIELYHGKERTQARKSISDFCAAYLIATWANNYYTEHGTYDAPTTSRYENG